jgi:hypothetical protein
LAAYAEVGINLKIGGGIMTTYPKLELVNESPLTEKRHNACEEAIGGALEGCRDELIVEMMEYDSSITKDEADTFINWVIYDSDWT